MQGGLQALNICNISHFQGNNIMKYKNNLT